MLKQAFQYLLFTRANNGKWAWEHDEYRKSCPGLQSPIASAFHLHSQWDEEGVISDIQRQVSELIGNPVHGSLHLDESGFLKSGDSSVGVKRQYCGRFGKVENCQVGVFLGYALWSRRTLIDKRLYLPEGWANDPVRRERCGVPDNITFKTKAELGLEMLLAARERGVPCLLYTSPSPRD